MHIEVTHPSVDELRTRGVSSWPIWEKEVSTFEYFYDTAEECYLLEGDVVVRTKDGREVQFGKGDFVRFPQGLGCTWEVRVPVRKHYNFE